MSVDTTHPATPAVTRHQPTPTGTRAARLARRAATCALLGTLVITGPWTLPAAGHDGTPQPAWPGPTGYHDPYGGPAAGPYTGPYAGSYAGPGWPPGGGGARAYWPVLEDGTWTRPVASGYEISAAYGIAGSWAAGHHTGVDFATPTGTTTRSVGPGEVVLAGDGGDYGNVVMVRMTDGYYALYAHLSQISVDDGEQLDGGEKVGETGATGRVTGPHLHFEIRTGTAYGSDVDPVAYLARHGVNLA